MRANRSEYHANVEGFTCARTRHVKATQRRGLVAFILSLFNR